MEINVKPLLCGEKRSVLFSYEIPFEWNENGYELDKNAEVCGEVKDMGGYILLSAKCKVSYRTVCARCLKELSGECSVEFERPVATKLESDNEEDEDLLVNENSAVNIDEAISEELLLSLPLRNLCSEDCKGLCPKCGCNLNERQCSCTLKEPDTRWAKLKDFKPNN
jgi:uncharacterized protein